MFRVFRQIILGTIAFYIMPCAAHAQITPRTAAGNTPAAIAATVASFKSDIGATDNGVGPAKTSGHRLITWDDTSDQTAAPTELERVLQDVARGVTFEGFDVFQISMDDNTGNDPDPDQVRFDNLHPGISTQLLAYSEQRLFTTFGTPRFNARFSVPGSSNGATVKGFGVVFVDVKLANTTSIELFDSQFNSLGVYYAPPGKFSFVGVSSASPYDIASVFVRHGNINIFGTENSERDIVVMDDIIFAEPQPGSFVFDPQSLTTVRSEKPSSTFDLVIKRVGSRALQASVEIAYEGAAEYGAGADFFYDRNVTFQSGDTEKRVTVSIKDDALLEGLEIERFVLTRPTAGHTIGTPDRATLLIADDELMPPTVYATNGTMLVGFSLDNPATLTFSSAIQNLPANDAIVGIDHRPSDGALIGLSTSSRLYRITVDGTIATATPIGNGPFSPALPQSMQYDVDFDPLTNHLRVTTGTTTLRLNTENGTVVGGAYDAPLTYAAGDPHAGQTPHVIGIGYTKSFPGTTSTSGYGIEFGGSLVRFDPSNRSLLTTVGPVGFQIVGGTLDIQQGTDLAFVIGRSTNVRDFDRLMLIDLSSGQLASIGGIGGANPISVRGVSIVPSGVLRMVAPASVTEGNSFQLRIERVGGRGGALTGDIAFAGGTVNPNDDILPGLSTSGFVFADGATTPVIRMYRTADDTAIEGTETLRVRVTAEPSYLADGTISTVQFIDNDAPSISISDVSVAEGNTGTSMALFTLTLNRADTNPVSVKYTTVDETAQANRDYVPVSGTATFAPGELTQTIAVTLIGDNFQEGASERFRLKLTDPTNAGFVNDEAVATITDTDNDTPPTYYLAEGATGPFFDTDVLLANPHAAEAPVTLTFLKQDATTVVHTMTLAPTSRTTVRVDDIPGLESTAVSTLVTSTSGLPIVVERTMRWDASNYGAHTERAVEGAAPTWYFAEGSQGFFFTYLLLANPHATENTATVQYLREGEAPVTRTYAIAPNARMTVDVSEDAELMNRSFGMIVTFAQPGVAERAMYFGTDPLWKAGHESAGVTTPSTSWFLAEGATGDFFETFVLMSNPQPADAEVTLTFLVTGGAPIVKTKTIPASGRLTVNIEAEDTALANVAVGTQVSSSVPIIVERAQYWPFSPDRWIEAHNSFGVTALGLKWGFAEGRTGGRDNYQTYVLVANPGAAAADVTLTFLRTNGTTVAKTVTVPPASRFNVATGPDGLVPELANEDFAVVIASTQPIAVERAMYLDAGGITWSAGTNATATRLP